ncbi:hypothetical protein V8E36_008330 [Tilletia maclaganii]
MPARQISALLLLLTAVSALPWSFLHDAASARDPGNGIESNTTITSGRTLRRHGSFTDGTLCQQNTDCLSNWCALPSEVGQSQPFEQRVCRRMPATGPCTDSSQLGEACAAGDECSSGAACPDSRICPLLPDFARAQSASDCRSGRITTNLPDLGWSLQSDYTLIRSELTFAYSFCAPATLDQPCDDYRDCGILNCNYNTRKCELGVTHSQCLSGAWCQSGLCGKGPYTLAANSMYCQYVPAGSRCAVNTQCGTQVCDVAGSKLCQKSPIGGQRWWNEDCPTGTKCGQQSTCEALVTTTTSTTTTTTTTTSASVSTTSSSISTSATTTSKSKPSTSSTTSSKPSSSAAASTTTTKPSTTSTSKTSTSPRSSSSTSSTKSSTSQPSTTSSKSGTTTTSTSTRSTTRTTSTTTTGTKTTTTRTTTTTTLPSGAPCGTLTAGCQRGFYCRARLNPDGTRSSQSYCDTQKGSGSACYTDAGCLGGVCSIGKGASSGTCK